MAEQKDTLAELREAAQEAFDAGTAVLVDPGPVLKLLAVVEAAKKYERLLLQAIRDGGGSAFVEPGPALHALRAALAALEGEKERGGR